MRKMIKEQNDEKKEANKRMVKRSMKRKHDTPSEKGMTPADKLTSNSETTIYKNAVDQVLDKGTDEQQYEHMEVDSEINFKLKRLPDRESTSSEDQIDTSDELLEVDISKQFIADCAAEAKRRSTTPVRSQQDQQEAADHAAQMIKDAESSKAKMFKTKGNVSEPITTPEVVQSTLFDENYMVIGGNIDPIIQCKIVNHEYVNFARLVPKGLASKSEVDHRMEIVSRGGSTFFVPVSDSV